MTTRFLTPLLLVLTLSACAPLPVSRDEPASGSVTGPEGETAPPGPSAVLLEQGRAQMSAAEYPAAAATLERAIRIEPGNPWLWLELAKVHRATGNLPQARAHAQKAASLAGGDDNARRAAEGLLNDIVGR